jgi:phosphatidylglycerol---prolipoprotein diacylglyceryl transferase
MIPYPEIDPVAVALGPIKVHWYGLAYLAGIAIGWWMAAIHCKRSWSPIKRDQLDDLVFYVALGVILGGRFGYILFYGLGKAADDPMWLLRVWEGGMSFHGGFLGVLLAMFIFGRQNNIRFGRLMDFVAPMVPVGLGLGRLGNFIGQELWGRATDVPWGMIFPADPFQLVRHPSQLYQFGLEGVLFLTIMLIYSRRERPVWAVSGVFSLVYGCVRFFAEFFREPDAHIGFQAFDWMTRGQMLCLPMMALGIYLLWASHRGLFDDKQPALGKTK